jgi:hypothetical protein
MNLEPLPKPAEPERRRRPAQRAAAGHPGRRRGRGGRHPSGKPKNARELLLAGVQDVTQMRASGKRKVNDVILAVLETLYTAMGFRFATVVLKDARSGQYRARVSFGANPPTSQAGFACSPAGSASAAAGATCSPGDGERRRPDDLGRDQPEDPRPAAGLAPRSCCRTRRASSCCRWWWARPSSACSTPTASRPRRKACRPTRRR